MAVTLARAATVEEALAKATRAASRIRVEL
jgi:phosphoribosylglycinamide formyltransferase 2